MVGLTDVPLQDSNRPSPEY